MTQTLRVSLRSSWQFFAIISGALLFAPLHAVSAEQEFRDPAWRYTIEQPDGNWFQPDFDDRDWNQGLGGFGDPSTPGARVATDWSSENIWLRRIIELPHVPVHPALLIHHDEDAEVYINGVQVFRAKGWLTKYRLVPLDETAAAAVKSGTNLIAVHCSQTSGGQFIDVHLADAENVPDLPAPPRRERPFLSQLITSWGEQVTADNAWQEYPRPGMTRADWTNLNGHWNYGVTSKAKLTPPEEWDGEILVPYCLESKLGGVQRLLHDDQALWYHRTFQAADRSGSQRVLLNFEAVDYECQVFVNGRPVGRHRGGNTPFRFDVTEALQNGTNHLLVRVEDATEGSQLHGKQTLSPRGIWYTQVSGIWQTVWMETVPSRYIDDLQITTNASDGSIRVQMKLAGTTNGSERIRLIVDRPEGAVQAENEDNSAEVSIPDARLWSPDAPHLYPMKVALLNDNGETLDEVGAYAGIRSVGKALDADGHWRITLNGRYIFPWGPLDQGWWPDGLLTPPSDEGLLWDLEFLKSAGFNMVRKHIKVEPRRYYYHCDRLGLMVWQDQVSGGPNPAWTQLDPNPQDADWTLEDHKQFMAEFAAMVDELENHPCIVVWIPFNEAWGQHRTVEVGNWIARRDTTRLINIASGGNFWPVGDIVDEHRYPHPGFPFDAQRYADSIKVVGEFGGHGFPVAGHLWDPSRDNWGYGDLPKDQTEYHQRYVESIGRLVELKRQGVAAGVYTQTTDVEGEVNGLVTYDRKVVKIPAEALRAIHQPLLDSSAAEK